MLRRQVFLLLGLTAIVLWATRPIAQQPPTATARTIDPAGVSLPLEADSGNQTKFAFIAYGDTRGPADGLLIQPAHRDVINRILASIPDEERAGFPVRFVVQSGDAVVAGQYANQWNVSFNPLIERLIHDGHVPVSLRGGQSRRRHDARSQSRARRGTAKRDGRNGPFLAARRDIAQAQCISDIWLWLRPLLLHRHRLEHRG